MKADDVLKALNPWLPSNFTQSSDEFLQWVKEEKHDVIYGDVVKSFEGIGKGKWLFLIYQQAFIAWKIQLKQKANFRLYNLHLFDN